MMNTYPRTLVDMTHAPYHPVASRIVDAINYAAAYEDRGLDFGDDSSALHDILAYWDEWQDEYLAVYERDGIDAATEHEIATDVDRVDRIADILADHGYILSVADDYPGLWVLDRADGPHVDKGMGASFDDWMVAVEQVMLDLAGVPPADIANWPYRQHYDDWIAANDAARAALDNEKFGG